MQAALATVGLIVVIVLALWLLSRSWVRSSRLGGYHATDHQGEQGRGPVPPEDDDARWHWEDREPPT